MSEPYEVHLRAAYTDSDWAGTVIDRRSTSGYCTFLGGQSGYLEEQEEEGGFSFQCRGRTPSS